MMEVSTWYLAERVLFLLVIVFSVAFAIYQWKIASVKPSLLSKFRKEAEAATHEKMAAEINEHEAVIEDFTRRIHNAQAWLVARQQESKEITQPVYDDLHEIRGECLKIRGASRQLTEACSLINALSQHKNFTESITTSQKSRILSVAREAKGEIKDVEAEVTELKSRVDKAEKKLKASEWIREVPPVVPNKESNDEALD
jgi:uncharacterized protein YlxW (UPF0749 family)